MQALLIETLPLQTFNMFNEMLSKSKKHEKM